MGSSRSSSVSDTVSLFLKLLGRALVVVGLVWILLVGTFESIGGTKTSGVAALAATSRSAGEMKGTEKLVHPELDLNYMSKRRVPNGPDPIHNRRAGKKVRPPGEA